MNARKRRVALVAAALPLVVSCSGTIPSLGGLGRIGQAALPIGPETEREIGFGIAATVAGRYQVARDPGLTRYVNLVGRTVAEQSIRPADVVFHFGVLDTEDVNAFAAPGGYIFVTRGALSLMESEAELAGVLGHEVAHVDETHVLDEIRRSSVFTSVQDEAQLSGPVLDQLSEVGGSLLFTGLSREDEMEADSLGILYATASGYRPDGLIRFLERLDASGAGAPIREWTATHPSEAERLTALRRQLSASGSDSTSGQDLADRFRRNVPGSP